MDRYLIRGFIDGLLSTLGIVIGASTAIGATGGAEGGVEASHIIVAAGLGGGVANGLSNVLGAFMGEKTALYKRIKKVEKAMLKEEALRGSKVDERLQNKIISSGIADGLATIGGALVPVVPFIFTSIFVFDPLMALYFSIIISLVLFFILGTYIGKISKENIILSGLKMMAFAGATAIVAALIRLAF